MIDDIVTLPVRLKQFKHDAVITSTTIRWLPMSTLCRRYGFESPDDTAIFPVGSQISMPTGLDAMFRYKFVEQIPAGICEYFIVSESPINILRPKLSKQNKIYCLWATVTDPKTLRGKKFIFWRSVFDICRFEIEDTTVDAPAEGVIGEELKAFRALYSLPREKNWFDTITSPDDVLVSQGGDRDKNIDALLQLGANMKAFNDAVDLQGSDSWWLNPNDVFVGVDLPEKPNFDLLKGATLFPMLVYGAAFFGNFTHLIGNKYIVHPYWRPFRDDHLHPATEISIRDEDSPIYEILKYAEDLPYSEIEVQMTSKLEGNSEFCDIKVYNPYDLNFEFNVSSTDQAKYIDPMVKHVREVLDRNISNWTRVCLTRSWSEETYITIEKADLSVERFYFDLAASVLSSRNLVRDYQGCMYAFGL